MFTGLITGQGECVEREEFAEGDISLGIASDIFARERLVIGCSIACSGVCLTLKSQEDGIGYFDVSKETLSCTTIASWVKGESINLECALKVGDEMGGHLVSGHVDGVVRIEEIYAEGQSYRYRFGLDRSMGRYIAEKGSVAIDGISLTVNSVSDKEHTTVFDVNIIPHTYEMTNLSRKEQGSLCNIEIDMLMRYMERIVDAKGIDRA